MNSPGSLRNTPVSSALALLAMGCAASVLCVTLAVLGAAHWHGPFRDMWEIYPFLQKIAEGSWGVVDLWESYGHSHRLFIPKLLYIADYHFAAASNHLLIAVSLLCQVGICCLFGRMLYSIQGMALAHKHLLLAFVVTSQFSATLLFNFMHTFDVQWFLTCFFVTLAVFCLWADAASRWPSALLAMLCILMACLCSFSAMAAWPLWLLFLWQRQQGSLVPWCKRYGWMLLLASAFIGLYAMDMRAEGARLLGQGNTWHSLFYLFIQFPLLYLANPVSDPDYFAWGPWGALLLVPALGAVLWNVRYFFYRSALSPLQNLQVALAALALFGVGVAVMTGLGRGYDPDHVRASRYQNVVLLFWAAAFCLLWLQVATMSVWKQLAWRAYGLLLLLALLACQLKSWQDNLLLGRNVSRAHLALMMGYADDVPMIAATVSRSMIYVPGYQLEKERALFEGARKGIYAGSPAREWLAGIAPENPAAPLCQGLSWQLRERVTPYTRYVEWTVEGSFAPGQRAFLLERSGRVAAIAQLDVPLQWGGLWQHYAASTVRNTLRGFARKGVAPGSEGLFILKSGDSLDEVCRMPYNPGLDNQQGEL